MTVPATPWDCAIRALELLAVDPAGLCGLWVRARSGPVREAFLRHADSLFPGMQRIHPAVSEDALSGGIDLAATLSQRRVAVRPGLLARGGPAVLVMAERCPAGLAVRLGQTLDQAALSLIALDEAAGPDEGLPAALADRLGLFADLDGVALGDIGDGPDPAAVELAEACMPTVRHAPADLETIALVAARLGIGSLRAPIIALAAARAQAALAGRQATDETDLETAVVLTLAHRGQPFPEAEQQPPPPPPDDTSDTSDDDPDQQDTRLPEDILLDAVRAALPPGLLASLAAGRAARSAKGSGGAGGARKGNRRGRPLPSRPGRLDGHARIDLVATLRSAAPMQKIRRTATGRDRLELRPDDIRLKRFHETSDRLLIFAVDASGSAALARLAEAKGAVELLLAEAYVRRDHVALVSFRGTGAEVLLPPTRSLVQTKRRLGGLPGGGGTPLAAGLKAALDLGLLARSRGMTPTIAVLTDGRANIALDGSAGRPMAEADATRLARAVRATGIPAVVIDTATRPQAALATLSRDLGATYLPLPRADAARLSSALAVTIGG